VVVVVADRLIVVPAVAAVVFLPTLSIGIVHLDFVAEIPEAEPSPEVAIVLVHAGQMVEDVVEVPVVGRNARLGDVGRRQACRPHGRAAPERAAVPASPEHEPNLSRSLPRRGGRTSRLRAS